MKKIFFPLLLFIIIFTCKNVYAEDFNQTNRFQYWTYNSSESQVDSGTGLINQQHYGTGLNRIQWLYSNYTYDSHYLYDLSFTVYFSANSYCDSPGNDCILNWVKSCQVSTGSGVYYQCYLNKGTANGKDYIQMSIVNMVGDGRNTTWLNIFNSSNEIVYLPTTNYNLQINRKENKNATSDDVYNASNNIINSQNNNTQQIIDNQNDNQQQTNDRLDDINDSITNSNTTQATNSGSTWFSNFRIDSSRGFSSIVTAPVRLIQGILTATSSSCTPLSYTINMKVTESSTIQSKEVSLPCGSALWNRVPSAVVLLYYTTIFGLFGWYVLRDMVLFVDKSQDPTDKSAFIMKL